MRAWIAPIRIFGEEGEGGAQWARRAMEGEEGGRDSEKKGVE